MERSIVSNCSDIRKAKGTESFMNRLMTIPFTFVLLNLAAVVGLFHFIRGSHDIWFRYRRDPHNAH
jgi:hypothetical protein